MARTWLPFPCGRHNIQDPRPEVQNPRLRIKIQDPESKIQNSRLGKKILSQGLRFKIQGPRSKVQCSRSKARKNLLNQRWQYMIESGGFSRQSSCCAKTHQPLSSQGASFSSIQRARSCGSGMVLPNRGEVFQGYRFEAGPWNERGLVFEQLKSCLFGPRRGVRFCFSSIILMSF